MLSTWPRRGLVGVVGEPQHRDHERDVGLDRLDDVARRRPLLGDEREHAVARLGQRREQLERLEGRGQALAVTLVARRPDERVGLAGARAARDRRAAGGLAADRDGVMRSSSVTGGRSWRIAERAPWPPFSPIGSRGRTVEPYPVRDSVAIRRRGVRRVRRRSAPARARGRPARPSRRSRARSSCPVSATRSGWNTCFAFMPGALDGAAQRRLDASGVHGSGTVRERRAATRERLARPLRARGTSRAPRGRRPGSSKNERASGQNSSSVEIFSCVTATASRRPAWPVSASSRAVRSSSAQLAQVAAVHPAQLLLVEHRGRLGDAARARTSRCSSSVVKNVVSSSKPQPSSAR